MTTRIAIASALCAVVTIGSEGTTAEDLKSQIDVHASALIEDGTAVGFVVGVLRGDERCVVSYGEATKGSRTAPTEQTVYEIGSISKVFTGILLADAVQRQLVQLEDPLQKHVPASVKVPVHEGKPITLLHLATHASGLPRMPNNMAPADPANPYAGYSEENMFDFLSKHELRRDPGEFEYSNYAVGLLGTLLAIRENRSYEELLVDRVCGPLGMTDTRITLTDGTRPRLAPPYNAGLVADKNWDLGAFAGAGGIRSTCHDMLLFAKANLQEDASPLSQAMRSSQEKRGEGAKGMAMGLGWHIARDGVTRFHNGMTGGYHAWLAVVRQPRVAVVVLSNTATESITALGETVTRIALGVAVDPPKRERKVRVEEATLKSYAGTYMISPLFLLTVTVEEGTLLVQGTGQPKLPVFASSPTEFHYKAVDARITFEPATDAKGAALILHQNGLDLRAPRLP